LWVFIFFTEFEIWGTLWGYIILIYKDIQCRWVKSCSRCVKAYNSRTPPPRAILTAARVGRYDHITPIYIPPYAVPPATLIPGSPVSGLTGSQGSRVTGHHGSQGYRVTDLTGSQGHWVIGSITRVFSITRISRVTMSHHYHGHRVIITMVLGHRVIGSPITMGLGLPSPGS
jgi:hypothetical protein